MDDFKGKMTEELKIAMKARDKLRTSVLRMVLSEFSVAGKAGKEPDGIEILKGYSKKLKKSIEEYDRLGSADNVEQLKKEVAVVEEFLPAQMGDDELAKIVDDILTANSITSKKEMGKAMKLVMADHGSVVDGKRVQAIVNEKLS